MEVTAASAETSDVGEAAEGQGDAGGGTRWRERSVVADGTVAVALMTGAEQEGGALMQKQENIKA